MNKKIIYMLAILAVLAISSIATPKVLELIEMQSNTYEPAEYAINPFDLSEMNSIDSSGGDSGWSPVYKQFDGHMMWNSLWSGEYRHQNSITSTSKGQSTVLQGDSDWDGELFGPSTANGFYQYIVVTVDPSITKYTLHLDFWFMEESSIENSDLNNWVIAIFDHAVTSWTTPLWHHTETDCDEHNLFLRQEFSVTLDESTLYIVIGHTDPDPLDRAQGHTKHFNEISIRPITTEEVGAIEDCVVSSANPDMNFNNYSLVVAEVYSFEALTYMKFSLNGIRDILSATLKMYCYEAVSITGEIVCNGLEDSSWSESTLTWNTQPTETPVELDSSFPSSESWQEWDVTSWAQSHENESAVSFVFSADENLVSASYYSVEDATTKENHLQYYPKLVIEGEYRLELANTSEFVDSFMEATYVLYDPPGEESYQVFKTATASSWNMEMGFELGAKVGIGFVGVGSVGGAVEIEYSHDWGFSETFTDIFSSSLNSSATGADGDAIVGRVINMTYIVYTYCRSGVGWTTYFVGKTEFVERALWIETAVVPRWWCNKTDAPFRVPEIPDMHRVLSLYNTSYYAGPGNPVTHSVTRTYEVGNSIDFSFGIKVKKDIVIDPLIMLCVHVELELKYNLKWTATSQTSIETEFHLEDPNGVLCYACAESPISMFDGELDTQSYIFWFYY